MGTLRCTCESTQPPRRASSPSNAAPVPSAPKSLHAAVAKSSPPFHPRAVAASPLPTAAFLAQLTKVYPAACRHKNAAGQLPLHAAIHSTRRGRGRGPGAAAIDARAPVAEEPAEKWGVVDGKLEKDESGCPGTEARCEETSAEHTGALLGVSAWRELPSP